MLVGHHDLYLDTKCRGLTSSHAAGGKINASVSCFMFDIAIKLLFERVLAWFLSWHCSASTPTLTLLHRVQGSKGRSWRHNTELGLPHSFTDQGFVFAPRRYAYCLVPWDWVFCKNPYYVAHTRHDWISKMQGAPGPAGTPEIWGVRILYYLVFLKPTSLLRLIT